MYIQRIGVVAALLCFFLGVWAVDCTNVTIANQDDADQVRKNCKTIQGWLTFDESLNESINLNGVEAVEGRISYAGDVEWEEENDIGSPYPTKTKPFTMEWSTLKSVNGSIWFWAWNGLSEIRFPKLKLVTDGMSLQRMHYLKTLDITSLTHTGSFSIEANQLTELKHEGLEGFTESIYVNSLSFWGVKIPSLDSWFKAPLDMYYQMRHYDRLSDNAPVYIQGNNLPNVKNITIGWTNISKVWIMGGPDIEIRFGGPETKKVDIGLLQLSGNISKVTRASTLKELNLGELHWDGSRLREIDLSVFDKITNLTISRHGDLQRIRMPPKAVDWEDMTIDITNNDNLTLTSEYRDPETKRDKFWYWPKGNISKINITLNPISTAFFDSFLAARNGSNPPKVLDSFFLRQAWQLQSEKMGFSCTPFEELYNKSVLPEDYECLNFDSENFASHALMSWSVIGVVVLSSAFHLLW